MERDNKSLFYFLVSFAFVLLIGDTLLFYFIIGKRVFLFLTIILLVFIGVYLIFKTSYNYQKKNNVSFIESKKETNNINNENIKNIVEKNFALYNIILVVELVIIIFLIIKLIAKF